MNNIILVHSSVIADPLVGGVLVLFKKLFLNLVS